MPFKDISYLELWWPICSANRNHLCTFGPGHYGEHFCEIISNLDQWFRRCCLKDISYLELWRPFCLAKRNQLFKFYIEGIIRKISVIFFSIQEMLFKYISYQALWWPLCSAERNHMCSFGRRHHEEQFCEIILNLDQWFRRCCLKIFLI